MKYLLILFLCVPCFAQIDSLSLLRSQLEMCREVQQVEAVKEMSAITIQGQLLVAQDKAENAFKWYAIIQGVCYAVLLLAVIHK